MAEVHVLVETNWVFDYAAPAHLREPAATMLLERASRGEISLYVPGICLHEARSALRRKFHPRQDANRAKTIGRWARQQETVSEDQVDGFYALINLFSQRVEHELDGLFRRIELLRANEHLEIFALDEEMLQRALDLGDEERVLGPFDQAILAAVLERGRRLAAHGDPVVFCELDSDLLPWHRGGAERPDLKRLYDEAGIQVFADFEIELEPSGADG